VTIVELQGVGPAREVWIAAVAEHARPAPGGEPHEVLRLARQIALGALHEELRMLLDPRVIERHVVADEIQHQTHAAVAEPLAQPLERGGPAEAAVHDVVANGEGRPDDVLGREVGQQLPMLGLQLGYPQRDRAPGVARLPHAEQPHPTRSRRRHAVKVDVRNIVERCRPPEHLADLVEPRSRVDLIERRKPAQRASIAFPRVSSIDSAPCDPNISMRVERAAAGAYFLPDLSSDTASACA